MSKHTPGPWYWDSDPVKGDEFARIRYRVVARGKTITQVYYSSYEGGLTNAEADAKLIATAPDLLALLQELIDIEGPCPGTATWASKVRAAIARATGET